VTFTTRKETCPSITNNRLRISQTEDAKYLTPRSQIELNTYIYQAKITWISTEEMYRLSSKSQLLKQVVIVQGIFQISLWRSIVEYGLQLEKYRNFTKIPKFLDIIINALWYVTNDITLHHDLNVPYIRDEIKILSQKYADKMEDHRNILTINLMRSIKIPRRLKRRFPEECV
jgi:hypothetical protein